MKKWKFKEGETKCHDCGRTFKKGDKLVTYEVSDQKTVFKCMECYDNNPALENFQKTEVYSRIVGYIRPVDQWNVGKSEEWKDRKTFACDNG